MKKMRNQVIIQLLTSMLVLTVILVAVEANVPDSPIEKSMYMTDWEQALEMVGGAALVLLLVWIGVIIGRFYEAYDYEREGNYLGKNEIQ